MIVVGAAYVVQRSTVYEAVYWQFRLRYSLSWNEWFFTNFWMVFFIIYKMFRFSFAIINQFSCSTRHKVTNKNKLISSNSRNNCLVGTSEPVSVLCALVSFTAQLIFFGLYGPTKYWTVQIFLFNRTFVSKFWLLCPCVNSNIREVPGQNYPF